MTKKSIAYYTVNRVTLPLGHLVLARGKFLEDIFYAVEDSDDFTILTEKLQDVICNHLTVDRVTDHYIRYKVEVLDGAPDDFDYLKIRVKVGE